MHDTFRQWKAVCTALVFGGTVLQAQGTGTIGGRVTNRATGAPIGDAIVSVVGTQRDTRTNEAGQYRLVGVSAGRVRIRVLRLGYAASLDSTTVSAGQEATLDLSLTATVTRLDQVTILGLHVEYRNTLNATLKQGQQIFGNSNVLRMDQICIAQPIAFNIHNEPMPMTMVQPFRTDI